MISEMKGKITENHCYIELGVGNTILNDWEKIIKNILLPNSLASVYVFAPL